MLDFLFETRDPLTGRLALLSGTLLLFSALGVVRKRARAEALLREIAASASIAHITGVVTFVLGGGLLLLHDANTQTPLEAMITLTGLWWMVEGAALLAAPDLLPLRKASTVTQYRLSNFAALGVGLYLLAGGLLSTLA